MSATRRSWPFGRLERRLWPPVLLLCAVLALAVGCIFWFMRVAVENERLATRERLSQFFQAQAEKAAKRLAGSLTDLLAAAAPNPALSAREQFGWIVHEHLADAALVRDEQGNILYPNDAATEVADPPPVWSAEVRELAARGEIAALVAHLQELLPEWRRQPTITAREAYALLLGAESAQGVKDPAAKDFATQLKTWVEDYRLPLSSPQRRFLGTALKNVFPQHEPKTLAAELQAVRFLESWSQAGRPDLHAGQNLGDCWVFPLPHRTSVLLFGTPTLARRLTSMLQQDPIAAGARAIILAPGDSASGEGPVAQAQLPEILPLWRVAIYLDEAALVNPAIAQRLRWHLGVAVAIVGALVLLAFALARVVAREMRLAGLKNDLVATVSHELKTPLTAMRALVETLLTEPAPPLASQREYLQLLAQENERLSRMIENFLTFSRLDQGRFRLNRRPCTAQEIVEGALEAFGERARQLVMRVEDPLPKLNGDPEALAIALVNLLENAWKFTGPAKRITLNVEAKQGAVHFSVADNGIGLDRRACARIFERFYQVDQKLSRTAGGSGLGLSIVQSLVRAHGGDIAVESTPGRGSVFTIRVPGAEFAASSSLTNA